MSQGRYYNSELVRAVFYCKDNGGLKACPEIGKRVEVTFAGMTATVLALITNIGTGRSTK